MALNIPKLRKVQSYSNIPSGESRKNTIYMCADGELWLIDTLGNETQLSGKAVLNGNPIHNPSFYAPTTGGTSGQILKSNGSGAPSWTTLNDIGAVAKAELLTSGKINLSYFPDSILGQMLYGGTFNPTTGKASTTQNLRSQKNISTTSDITLATTENATYGYKKLEGAYFILSDNGEWNGIDFEVGDWLVSTTSGWKKIDNTDTIREIHLNGGDNLINAHSVNINAVTSISPASSSHLTGGAVNAQGVVTIGVETNYQIPKKATSFWGQVWNGTDSVQGNLQYVGNITPSDNTKALGTTSNRFEVHARNVDASGGVSAVGLTDLSFGSAGGTGSTNGIKYEGSDEVYNSNSDGVVTLPALSWENLQDKPTDYASLLTAIDGLGAAFNAKANTTTVNEQINALSEDLRGQINTLNSKDQFDEIHVGYGNFDTLSVNNTIEGNAASANEFASDKTIKLQGGVTGEVASKGGWTISTTIADNAVTTSKISNSNVTTAKIADGAVTNDKLANPSITLAGQSVSLGGSISKATMLSKLNVADGAQVNVIETVKLNNTALSVSSKAVNVNALTSLVMPTGLTATNLSSDGQITVSITSGYMIPRKNRTFWGQAWNGNDNVSGDITDAGNIEASGNISADGGMSAKGLTDLSISSGGGTGSTNAVLFDDNVSVSTDAYNSDSNGVIHLPTYKVSNIAGLESALSTKADKSNTYTKAETRDYTDTAIANLVGSAPSTLDTLGELADALRDNADIVTVLESSIATKVDKVSGKGLSTNDFTTTYKNKLDGIASGAQVNVIESIEIAGKTASISSKKATITKANLLAGLNVEDGANNYTLPTATSSALGGIKIGYSESGDNFAVKLSSGTAYVTIPLTDLRTSIDNSVTSLQGQIDALLARDQFSELYSEYAHLGVLSSDTINVTESVTAPTFVGDLQGNAATASKILDSQNSNQISITYSKAGQASTNWLASWNGYELGSISPVNITAGKATILATSRTIWGQSFNGSANVSGDLELNTGTQTSVNTSSAKLWFNGGVFPTQITGPYIQAVSETYGYGRKRLSVFQHGANDYTTPNTEVFSILSNGNVGINSNSPAYKLYVNGTFRSSNNSSIGGTLTVDSTLNISGVSNLNNDVKVSKSGINANLNITPTSTTVDYVHMYVTGSSNPTGRPLVLQNGYGNVGIGVVAPTEKLHVNGNILAEQGVSAKGLTDLSVAGSGGGTGSTNAVQIGEETYNPNSNGVIVLPDYTIENISGLTTALSGKSNVGHTHTFASLTERPTTLSGYGITDAKIANGVITLGNQTITPLTQHQSLQGYATQQWVNDKGYTTNVGTITGIKMNGTTKGSSGLVDLGNVVTEQYQLTKTKVENVLTGDISTHTHSQYLTSETALSISTTGSGNAITSISVSGHAITATKDKTFSESGHTHSYLPLTGGTVTGNITAPKFIGALQGKADTAGNSDTVTCLGSTGNNGIDANNPTKTIIYDYGSGNSRLNMPSGWQYGSVFTMSAYNSINAALSGQFCWDVAHATTNVGRLWFRTKDTNGWKSWEELPTETRVSTLQSKLQGQIDALLARDQFSELYSEYAHLNVITASTLNVDDVTSLNTLNAAGAITTNSTTDATSTATGALIVKGGVGIAKQLRVAGATTLSSTLTVTGTTYLASLAVSGATQINNTLGVSGIVTISNTTAPTSHSAGGALKVSGGVAINGKMWSNTAQVTTWMKIGTNISLGQYNSSRPELLICSNNDNPSELWLGTNNTRRWSIGARANSDANMLGIWSTTASKYIMRIQNNGYVDVTGSIRATGGVSAAGIVDLNIYNN